MKISELFENTTAGAIATVNSSMGTIKRRTDEPSLFGSVVETGNDLSSINTPDINTIAKIHNIKNTSKLIQELKLGIKEEMEHTTDKDVAKEIALDHLAENPKYYSKLKKAGL